MDSSSSIHRPTLQVIPVNPWHVPKIPEEELEGLPEGYKHLAWGQRKLGALPCFTSSPCRP